MKTSKANSRVKGIYLRGSVYWYRFTHEGKQMRVPLRTEDELEAIAAALEIQRNPELLPSDVFRSEAQRYVTEMRARKKHTDRTGPETERILTKFAAHINAKEPASVTTRQVQDWYQWLKTDEIAEDGKILRPALTEDSAQTYFARVAGFFRWLVESKKSRFNPTDDVELSDLIRVPRRHFFSPGVRNTLIDNCTRADLKFCLYGGFHAGLRKGEIIEARTDWFDFEQEVIHIPVTEYWHPKGKKGRDVPLTSEFKEFLLELQRENTGTWIHGAYVLHPEHIRGKYRYRWDFRRPFDDYMEAEGHPEAYPHMMRKTFGSLLASRGVSLFKIASWLGDDIRTTQRNYAWLQPKDDEIEKAFSRAA